jgi:putative acetyltransferase
VEIRRDDLRGDQVLALIAEHLRGMHAASPAESVHALGVEALRGPEITFWSAWEGAELLGCGALKELDPRQGEIKSMRTAAPHLRKGVAAAMVRHIVEEATRRGYTRLSLETGSMDEFAPARTLYAKYGFTVCGPFADYGDDPNSTYMTRSL